MPNKDEALKMAIEFMGTLTIDVGIKTWNEKHRKEAIQACKEALEQPAQEPYQCHWVEKGKGHCERNKRMGFADDYGQPAQFGAEYMVNEGGTGTVLRKQPAQEPVAWIYEWEDETAAKLTFHPDSKAKVIPLYTHPAPSWQGLSGDEIEEVLMNYEGWGRIDFARAIEAKLKEKNHG